MIMPPRCDTYYPNTGAVHPEEKYFVCKRNGSIERVIQSDRSPERAQHSVDILNEHETNNAREANFYWRLRKAGETDDHVRRHWRTRDAA